MENTAFTVAPAFGTALSNSAVPSRVVVLDTYIRPYMLDLGPAVHASSQSVDLVSRLDAAVQSRTSTQQEFMGVAVTGMVSSLPV